MIGAGNHWVERILLLKETCRLHSRATYAVLVDAVRCLALQEGMCDNTQKAISLSSSMRYRLVIASVGLT
jgi:hypothetical protein